MEKTLFGLHVKHNESFKGLIYCSPDPPNLGRSDRELIKNAIIYSPTIEFDSIELSSCCWKQNIDNLKNGLNFQWIEFPSLLSKLQ